MTDTVTTHAFDKQSARTFDTEGRMRVRSSVISVAEVNPYYGREIPRHKELGLDPNKVYDLYRDPEALAAAVESFNVPLMIRHVIQTAAEPRKEYVGGMVYAPSFDGTRLTADLLVTDRQAIEYINSGILADLSSGYRYRADMTPGEVNGRKFDGRMVDIVGNHVALVEDGRATGAHVADSALSSQPGALPVENDTPNPAPAGNADVGQAILLITQKLDSLAAEVGALKQERPNPAATIAVDESEEAREDERVGEEVAVALDAKSVQAVVDAAVLTERKRASAVEQAKRDTRAVLGDVIALDSAGDIYREALKRSGADMSAIGEGAEQIAWNALQSVTGSRGPAHALDATIDADAPRHKFDLSNIKIR